MENAPAAAYTVAELGTLFVSFIPAGFLLGCFPVLAGVAVQGLMNIFKKA